MDRFHVYRPMLDTIGFSEGTDKGDGYNETLGYGDYTGGDVDLVSMSLAEVDRLQGRMLKHPKNRLNSSAVGRYQIVRTTRRAIQKALGIPGSATFDAAMQDRMACYLLGVRGIDKYLAGRLSEDTLLTNLAKEWASLPTPSGKGFYGGQRAAVKPSRVRAALRRCRELHAAGQPVKTVEKPVVPEEVEEQVQKKTGLWQKITGWFGGGAIGGGFLWGLDWQTLAVGAAVVIVVLLLIVLLRRQIVGAVREIREGLA